MSGTENRQRTHQIGIRLTADEYAAVEKLADYLGISHSKALRSLDWRQGYRDAMQATVGMQGTPNVGAQFPADWESHNPYTPDWIAGQAGEAR